MKLEKTPEVPLPREASLDADDGAAPGTAPGRQEKYLRLLLENCPDIILMLDGDGKVAFCSAELLKLAGIGESPDPGGFSSETAAAGSGWSLKDLYTVLGDEEFVQKGLKRFQSVKETLMPIKTRQLIKFPALDEPRLYLIQAVPMLNESGWFDGVLAIYSDATSLRDAEVEERTRIMLNATPLACSLLDQDGNLIDCNAETLRLFGLKEKSDYAKRLGDLSPEFQPDGSNSAERSRAYERAALETGYQQFEWMHRTPSTCKELPTEVTLVRVPWKDQYCLAAYCRDLREIKEKERQMREADEYARELEIANRAALEASEAKSRFLASVSHEIRTPMNAIIGMSELIPTDNLDKVQKRYFTDIRNMSRSLLGIINDILDLSKIEAGKMDISPVDYDIFELYDNVCSVIRFTTASKSLMFRHTISERIPRVLYGDPVRARQIITNLLSNAIKYTVTGYVELDLGRVTKDGREYLSIRVEDSGIGIKKENFPRLFEAFEQIDRQKNRNVTGTGLGLPITKMLAQLMGGEISVESEYDKGSVFTVLLPLKAGDPAKVEHARELKCLAMFHDANVLVVDDNTVNLTVALGFLRRHGIDADTAESGVEALEKVAAKRYDLVFMDHMMPDMDGIEAAAAIRALPGKYYKDLPVIALSANAVAGMREIFLGAGMNDFISKPINPVELNHILMQWMPNDKLSDSAALIAGEPAPPIGEDRVRGSLPEVPVSEDTAGYSKLITKLSDIADLSVTTGLSRVDNDKAVYIKILRQFCQWLDKDLTALRSFSADGDWKQYAVRIHAVKSVFANIGNQFMADWALELEKAAAGGDTDKCLRQTKNFCVDMNKFRVQLINAGLMDPEAAPAGARSDKKSMGAGAPPAGFLREKLLLLRQACLDCATDTVNALTEELRETNIGNGVDALLSKICSLAESFDYEEAAEICGKAAALLAES
ncbi:MAG: response regulator [Clostridiales bacterium]|nr:response regulator [Clostridiales bacterium]